MSRQHARGKEREPLIVWGKNDPMTSLCLAQMRSFKLIRYPLERQWRLNMNKVLSHLIAIAVVFVAFAYTLSAARAQKGDTRAKANERVMHKTVNIDGPDIFYREVGSPANPTVLWLHGFPTSSQLFRNLRLQLAGRYHVVAPDYPGYGNGSAPAVDKFDYTFDNIANVMDKFAQALKLERYSLYVLDYGAPIGYRLAVKHPERVQTLIIQNGNACEEGLRDFWIPLRAYWKDRSEQNAEPLRKGGKWLKHL